MGPRGRWACLTRGPVSPDPGEGGPAKNPLAIVRKLPWTLFLVTAPVCASCGDDGTGPEEKTGATLQGSVIHFSAAPSQAVDPGFQAAAVILAQGGGVKITIGKESTRTDGSGIFNLRNIPVGDVMVSFARDGHTAHTP